MGDEEREQIIQKVKNYFKDKHEVVFVYIFGSYARHKETGLSDVDIAIYYENDEISQDIEAYLSIKAELNRLLNKEVDLVILNTAKPLLKSRIINHHIKILSRNRLVESEFMIRSLGEYFDVKPYLDAQYINVITTLKEEIKNG
ncbi:type VII toxin-antitoxin system MntA family adenylyltransferase antitoxin [Petroclostridium xylanilyticum]|jgi:hypothetical protein|uniref:type VII toxin-antitoxin system MntA family adenylyltransferase antitoxin n=1 Tax=Petroclostridium xylanilyticum TaxID=1792311 RepID=UPI000B982F3A|nr:nucleotidyltransferase domain-containing protein [Petroclostridium xylanilyticum]